MVQVLNYPKAYTETLEILKYLDENEYKKIDQSFINMMKKNKDINHIFEINQNLQIEEQDILRETKTIIAYIYLHYLCTDEEKQVINYKFKQDVIKSEQKKQDKYNVEEFYKKLNENSKLKNTESVSLIPYSKIKWYQKIFNKLIAFIKKMRT